MKAAILIQPRLCFQFAFMLFTYRFEVTGRCWLKAEWSVKSCIYATLMCQNKAESYGWFYFYISI